MKIILKLAAISLLIFTQTCNNTNKQEAPATTQTEVNQNAMEITGTIQEQGITSYQYGTHTITTATDEFYALKSNTVDLNDYIDEEVTIVAEKIEGYPLSGGPEYLLVLKVK